MSEFLEFNKHIDIFENNKHDIVTSWVGEHDVSDILEFHGISTTQFAQEFAIFVLDYFLHVAKGESRIGDCPVMGKFLQFLRNRDITAAELFTICTHFRKSMIGTAFRYDIVTAELYEEIATIFDQNFRGVLETFSKTIKQAEENLQETTSLLNNYKLAMDQMAIVCKTDAYGYINYVNAALCKHFHYKQEEVLHKPLSFLFHPNMGDSYMNALWDKLQRGKNFQDTIQAIENDGDTLYLDMVMVPLTDYAKHITGYMFVAHDVTQQLSSMESALKAEELALAAKQEAEEAEKAKDDFLSSMSHEIRTPLNAIMGFVSLLQESEMSAQNRNYLEIISNSGQSLLTIINDILDFAKIRSGKFTIDPFDANPIHEFSQVLELFKSKIDEKHINYISYIDPRFPKRISMDFVRVKQIISNFLSNAIKFTPQNGTIEVQILFDAKKQELLVSVKDTGIGIDKKSLKTIFGEFTQETQSTAREHGGTGLGLSICQSLVHMMHGKIGVKSSKGKGSLFFCYIPLTVKEPFEAISCNKHLILLDEIHNKEQIDLMAKYCKEMHISYEKCKTPDKAKESQGLYVLSSEYFERERSFFQEKSCLILANTYDEYQELGEKIKWLYAPITPEKLLHLLGDTLNEGEQLEVLEKKQYSGKVLVAEDNKTNQMLIEILLQEYGVEYILVENGQKAVEAFKEGAFDLVLMDHNMPVMSGIEATKAILAYEQEQKKPYTPIIALTANATKEDKQMFLSSGMDDFISKPIDIKELERIFDIYLQEGVYA